MILMFFALSKYKQQQSESIEFDYFEFRHLSKATNKHVIPHLPGNYFVTEKQR